MSAAAEAAPAPGSGPSSRRASFRRLWGYLLRNRGRYVAGVLATIAYAGSSVAIPLLVGWSIRALVEGLPGAEVGRRAALLAVVTVLRASLRFASRTQIFNAAREIENELRNDLFAHLQRLPQSFYASWRTGDLMSRCVNDLNSLRLLLGPGLLALIQNPPLYLGVLAAMFAINAKLALLVLVPYPLFVLIARGFGRHMHSANVAVQEGLADLSSQLQESVSGIAVVKAYAMEPASQRRFDAAADALYRRHLRLVRVSSAMPAIVSLLPALAMWVVFLVGGRLAVAGDLTVDRFFTFAMYVYELTFPTFIMGWVFALWQRGGAAMQRVDEVLRTEPAIADHAERVPLAELRGEIEFRGLTFRHSDTEREPALRDIRLKVPAGSVLGVVGPVGSGKTTLASLIPRLYEVDDGMLLLDGVWPTGCPPSRPRPSGSTRPPSAPSWRRTWRSCLGAIRPSSASAA
jgi:ATP-binding cassette subfamily B protein